MAEVEPAGKAARERSPSFPFIALKGALERLVEFEKTFSRQEPPADRVYLAWGYKGDTSQAQQTLAALKAFGLVEYKGSGPKRPVAISGDARTYLRAQQDSVKSEVVKRIALKPKWIQHFWSIWGTDRVPDPIRLDDLVLKHKFNESAAPTFLKVYDDTIAFAGLADSDKDLGDAGELGSEGGGDGRTDFAVGDWVNWESNGQVQWREPRKIVGVDEHDDGRLFYKVLAGGQPAEEAGWIPVEQAIAAEIGKPGTAERASFKPPMADAETPPKPGSRKAVFPVEEGDVTLIFPEGLSKEGLAELGEYLAIFLKKEEKKAASN